MNPFQRHPLRHPLPLGLLCPLRPLQGLVAATVLLLAACGGGNETAPGEAATMQAAAPSPHTTPIDAQTQALQASGARLNAQELDQIARTGVLPQPFDGPLLSGAPGSTLATLDTHAAKSAPGLSEPKSATSRVPVFRFFNSGTGAHFFTTSVAERDHIIANVPAFSYEGPAFHTSNAAAFGLSPVHRFFNQQSGVHFYTISEAERAHIVANLPQFHYEGIAYYASTLSGTGYVPLFRFYYAARGFHFYTVSEAERNQILANLPQYTYEGVGYYVLGDDWQTPAVPHTGVTALQCHIAGTDTLSSCTSLSANSLNNQQDGDRTQINPMGYSPVSPHSTADCVRDDVTGLVWEVKTVGGARSATSTYRASLGFAGDPTTVNGYIATVNDANLCGFNDWRLPSFEELHGLLNYGQGEGLFITTSAFPNTQRGAGDWYWSATNSVDNPNQAWLLGFYNGDDFRDDKTDSHHVRLVRGRTWTGQRHIITSLAYPGDAAGNAVIDRRTGLAWRRCHEGQTWNGAACTGSASIYTHVQALSHAQAVANWRLPNVKELASVIDHGQLFPALDPVSFPGALSITVWSSTPYISNSAAATGISFGLGLGHLGVRTAANRVRLVFAAP
ncbi:MAG: DUF1566 domain-containing protein [Burkholderiaceae bacterium]